MDLGKQVSGDGSQTEDFEGVCQRIRAALEPVRTYAASLHDVDGNLLWLTEGSMGPDEHEAVRRSFENFTSDSGPTAVSYDLGDTRSAVLFRVTNAQREVAGAAMVIVETRILSQYPRGPNQLMTQKLLRALAEFAVMQRRRLAKAATGEHPAPTAKPAAPGLQAAPSLDDTASRRIATAKPVRSDIDQLNAALRASPIKLYVQRLMPLAKGGKHKHYEILLRTNFDMSANSAPQAMLKAAVESGLGSMIDRRVVTELVAWLVRNPAAWRDSGKQFSVNLTKTALYDEHFLKFVQLCLEKAALPKATIAFEIDVPTAHQCATRIQTIAASLHQLGCPLVLDDFGMRTECFGLLRLPGVKYIKIAPSITKHMRTDKLSQAAITALVQMSRVLGMHTVAKRTEPGPEKEWLTALGVDFVQSHALSPPEPIGTLAPLPASLLPTP